MNMSHLPPDVRSHRTRAEELLDDTDYGRTELLKPLILLAVCAPLDVLLSASIGGHSLIAEIVWYPVGLVIGTVLGMAALLIGVAIGAIDEGGPLFLGILRMAGAIAALYLASAFFGAVPIFLLSYIVIFLIFAGVMYWLFEMTMLESLVLALILMILQLVLVFGLLGL